MFDDTRLYPANDPAVTQTIAPYSTMAHWRCEARGPAYIKIGPRVMYSASRYAARGAVPVLPAERAER